VPAGAGPAPDAANDAAADAPGIRWVGQQWLMEGFCGRAAVTAGAAAEPAPLPANEAEPAPSQSGARAYSIRPVTLPPRPRHRVVRIGPRPRAEDGAGGLGTGYGETQASAA
jgi:hypothetical protein